MRNCDIDSFYRALIFLNLFSCKKVFLKCVNKFKMMARRIYKKEIFWQKIHNLQYITFNTQPSIGHSQWDTPNGTHRTGHTQWDTFNGTHRIGHNQRDTPNETHSTRHTQNIYFQNILPKCLLQIDSLNFPFKQVANRDVGLVLFPLEVKSLSARRLLVH